MKREIHGLAERAVYLVDNGSLRAEAILNLRQVAERLSERLGRKVEAVSVLHSDRVPPEQLEGKPALLLETALRHLAAAGGRRAVVVPFFFGPTGALTEYLPQRLQALREEGLYVEVDMAPFLFPGDGADDGLLGEIMAERVIETLQAHALQHPPVILVDHGSPLASVTFVRNYLAGQLSVRLRGMAGPVGAASMERRDGEQYAFNEPLLADKLRETPFDRGNVVVAQLFLSPGRHAGEGGDIARICREAEEANPTLRTFRTKLVGTHPRLIDLLLKRCSTVLL